MPIRICLWISSEKSETSVELYVMFEAKFFVANGHLGMLVNRLVVLFDVAQQRVLTAAIPCLTGWSVDAPVHFRSINDFLDVNYQISNQLSALSWATGGSAQMRGFETGVGSKAVIGARPVVTAPAWRASAERPGFPAGMEGRFTRGKVKAPGRRHPAPIRRNFLEVAVCRAG